MNAFRYAQAHDAASAIAALAADPRARYIAGGTNVIDLMKVAGNQRWAGAGQFDLPLVLMTPSGSGIRGSLYHSHSFESWATRLPG